uniref:EF-hand domain-containing protein n=1 Tax=Monodelphis domestica TaxID=13616 RepID=F6SI13_MONDO
MPYLRASVLRNMLDNKRDTKEEQAEKIRAAFELFEEDGSRTISVRNLPIAMRPLGFRPDRKEVEQLKAELDKEGSGKVHFSDFLALMTKKMAERNVEEEIQKAFPFFDDEDTGTITLKSLKRVASELGEKVSEEELQDMIDHADLNGDGEVDPHELLSVIKKARKNSMVRDYNYINSLVESAYVQVGEHNTRSVPERPTFLPPLHTCLRTSVTSSTPLPSSPRDICCLHSKAWALFSPGRQRKRE